MAPQDFNGILAFNNGSSQGPAPPSPPLQTVELREQVGNFKQAVQIISQNLNIFDNVNAALSMNEKAQAALDANHDHIHRVKTENNGLQSQLKSKETTIQELQDQVQNLQRDRASKYQALKDRTQDTVRLEAKLKEETAKVESLREASETLAKDKKDLKAIAAQQAADLNVLNDKVKELQAQLDKLNGYALPTHDLPLHEVSEKLGSIFQPAFGIVSKCFANDLPPRVFVRDNDDWLTFSGALAGTGIPLPPSNSPDAKRMRVAAVLRLLADVSRQELFQPFYTLEHGNELRDGLQKRIDDDDHADFVRRVLLRTEPASLDNASVVARARAVEKTLKKVVRGILSQEAQDVFLAAIYRWCIETAQMWRVNIQPQRDDVHAHIDLEDTELIADDWCVLSATPEWVPVNNAGAGNGTRSSPNGSASGSANARPTAPANTPLASIKDVAAYVWPLFWANGEIVQHGLVVTKAQVAQARREVDQRTIQQDSSRRNSRALGRPRSSTNGSAPNTPASATPASRPF